MRMSVPRLSMLWSQFRTVCCWCFLFLGIYFCAWEKWFIRFEEFRKNRFDSYLVHVHNSLFSVPAVFRDSAVYRLGSVNWRILGDSLCCR
jgi:hypothetical protein